MKKQFRLQVKGTGEVLCYFETLPEAQLSMGACKEWDHNNTYEIAELTLDGTYKPVES